MSRSGRGFAKLFILGDPADHSLSPEMQGAALAAAGIRGAYVPVEVAPGRLAGAVDALHTLGFLGGNVTIPHKERIARCLERTTEKARAIGAVNCLTRGRRGFVGDNTDGEGFLGAFAARGRGRLRGGRLLLVGAGGAARAVLFAAVRAGVREVLVVNRTAARARSLARSAGDWGATHVAHAGLSEGLAAAGGASERWDVVVNATSVGLAEPHPGAIVPGRVLSRALAAVDLVYAMGPTRFAAEARARGLRVADGIDILAAQGRHSFTLWFGAAPPAALFARAARAAWREREASRRRAPRPGGETRPPARGSMSRSARPGGERRPPARGR